MKNQDSSSKKLQALYFPQKKEEYEKPIHEAPILRITGEAYKKLNLYSRIVSEIFGSDIECGGKMLNYTGRDDGVIRDAYLQYQRVSSGDGHLMDNPQIDNYYAQQRGMSWAGMWHSHGHNGIFHSNFDNDRIKYLHENINKPQRLCMLKSSPKHHYQRKTVNGNKLILECDLQPLSVVINFDSNEAAKAAAESVEIRDEVFYTPSLVINKDEYLNDGPCRTYYAEFLVGDGKNPDVKVKNAKLEIIGENNNIMPTLEDIVLEIGEKVKYATGSRENDPGIKLKNLPTYNKILEKYKRIDKTENYGKNVGHIEQIVNDEKSQDSDKDTLPVEQIVSDEKEQGIEHNQELRRTKTYMERVEEFYDYLNMYSDPTYKMLAELCRAYSGKQYRFWNDRLEKGNEILKKLKKKYLTLEQKDMLRIIRNIVKSNKYLKRKRPLVYQDLQRRLDSDNPNFYCNFAYHKDKLSNSLKSKKGPYNPLEEKVQNINIPTTSPNNPGQPKKTFRSYLKSIAKYAGIAALATAMVLLPAKYCSKSYYNNKAAAVYTIKKGDNLWNLTKDYLKNNKIRADDKTIYKAVDKAAEYNGKGKQAEYKVGGKEEKNPHYIKPGQKIIFPKKVLDLIQQGGKK